MKQPLLSIVVPVLNEERRLPEKFSPYAAALRRLCPDCEYVFVDDGSTDGTLHILEEFRHTYPEVRHLHFARNHGRGFAMRQGVLAAKGEYILETDADFPVSPEHVLTFLTFLKQNPHYQLAIGSREHPDSQFVQKQPAPRVFAGKAFHVLFWLLFQMRFNDVMCGFKMFPRETAREIFRRVYDERYLAAAEIVIAAVRLNYRLKELPVAWEDDRRSKVNIVRDSLRTIIGLAKVFYRDRRGLYG